MRSLILIRRCGWSGRIASNPLFRVSFFFPYFLFCFLRLAYKSRRRMNRHRSTLLDVFCAKNVPFWGYNFYICFTFVPIFHQKRSKLSPKYRKTSDRSRSPDRRRAPYTGRGTDSIVPIEAGPRLQAGSRTQAGGVVKYGCCLPVKCPSTTYR